MRRCMRDEVAGKQRHGEHGPGRKMIPIHERSKWFGALVWRTPPPVHQTVRCRALRECDRREQEACHSDDSGHRAHAAEVEYPPRRGEQQDRSRKQHERSARRRRIDRDRKRTARIDERQRVAHREASGIDDAEDATRQRHELDRDRSSRREQPQIERSGARAFEERRPVGSGDRETHECGDHERRQIQPAKRERGPRENTAERRRSRVG